MPQMIDVLADPACPVTPDEIVLYDVDQDRLHVMGDVITQKYAHLPALRTTTDLVDAVSDATVVFSAMRIGGTCGRTIDEREALNRGVLGQETVGAGGYAYALRTLPYAMELATAVAEHAPRAWLINFTNPAGIITQAMQTVLGERAIGICDTPIGLIRRTAALAGYSEFDVDYDYVGLNHLGWLRSMTADGTDILPGILADSERLGTLEEARTIGTEWIQQLGMIPNEYLYYYYLGRESRAAVADGQTRGEFLHEQQGDFYAKSLADPDHAADYWTAAHDEREATYMAEAREDGDERTEEDIAAGGYAEVAVNLMTALLTGRPARMILGVANFSEGRRLIAELSDDAVVEVPCDVDGAGIHPRDVAPLTGAELGLVVTVKSCEEMILEASRTASISKAWQALGSHPLVDSVRVARELIEAYVAKHPDLAYLN